MNSADAGITSDKDSRVSDPHNTPRQDQELDDQQQDLVLTRLAEAWLFALELLVEEEAEDTYTSHQRTNVTLEAVGWKHRNK